MRFVLFNVIDKYAQPKQSEIVCLNRVTLLHAASSDQENVTEKQKTGREEGRQKRTDRQTENTITNIHHYNYYRILTNK